MTKKYPVGTPIRYIGYCAKCKGKTGKIVSIGEACYYITLPQSTCGAFNGRDRIACGLKDIESLVVKGQQLLFDFMCQNA